MLVAVEDHRDGTVTDGVLPLKTRRMGACETLVQPLLIIDGDTAVARVVDIVGRHGGGATPPEPSWKSLAGPMRSQVSPQPVRIPSRAKRVEGVVDHHHGEDTHRQLSGRGQLLVGGEFVVEVRTLASPTLVMPKARKRSPAARRASFEFGAGGAGICSWIRLMAVAEETGRLAPVVAVDLPALGSGVDRVMPARASAAELATPR